MSTHRKGASVSIVLILLLSCSHDWNNPVTRKENQKEEIPTQGLVAWYPFNGNARDESGSGFDGTAKGPVLTSDRFGKANSAYLFDGVDDFIDTNHDFSWSVEDSFSLSLWFATRNKSQIQVLIGKDGAQYYEYALSIVSQRLWYYYFRPDGDSELDLLAESTIPDDNIWYHASVTYNGKTRTGHLYINGILTAMKINIGATFQDHSNTTQIGYGYYNNRVAHAFNGAIDDMRIYDRALTAAEVLALAHEGGYYAPLEKPVLSAAGSSDTAIRVQWKRVAEAESYSLEQSAARTGPFSQIYSGADSSFSHEGLNKNQTVWYRLKASNSHTASAWSDTISATASAVPTQGLVAWYPLNGTPNDQSGNGLNGVVHGALVTADRFNQSGKAYYFNGATFIEVADNGLLDITRNLTLCAWYRCDGKSTDWGRVVSKSWNSFNDPWISYGFVHDTNGSGNQVLSLMVGLSNSTSTSSGGSKTTFAIGKWHFLCGIFDSDMKKIAFYVDGIKEAEAALTVTALAVTNGNFAIGRDVVSGQGIVGSVDDVRIYNRILSPIEILALYHEGGFGL